MDKEIWGLMDKYREGMQQPHQLGIGIVAVAIDKPELLRQIASSTDVSEQLEQVIKQLPYSDITKEKLKQNVTSFVDNSSIRNLINILMDYAKLLESSNSSQVLDTLVFLMEGKGGFVRASEEQTKIVQHFFNIQKGQKVFSGRVGKGIEIAELLDTEITTTVYGQDFAKEDLILAEIRLHLNGFEHVQLEVANILTDQAFGNQKFDYVYDTPRFGIKPLPQDMDQLKIDQRYSYYGVPNKMNADLGYVVADIYALNDSGKGAFYLTTSTLSRGGADQIIRERFISNDIIEAVIEFPGGFYTPATSISSVLLLVNKAKPKSQKNKILFINATALSQTVHKKTNLTKQGLNEIFTILSEQKEVKGISKVIDASKLHDYELVPSRYVFENEMELEMYGTVEVNLPALEAVQTIPLSEVGEIFRGYNALSKYENASGNVAMLKIADIVDGEIKEEHLTRYELGGRVKIDNYRLQQNDIILSIRGQLKVALFNSEKDDVLLSQNFIGIRCKKQFNPVFVKLYLESPTMQFIMHNKLTGSTVLNLPIKEIEEFMIPLLPLERQQQIVVKYEQQQIKLKEQLKKIQEKLKESKLNVFKEMGIKETFRLK